MRIVPKMSFPVRKSSINSSENDIKKTPQQTLKPTLEVFKKFNLSFLTVIHFYHLEP